MLLAKELLRIKVKVVFKIETFWVFGLESLSEIVVGRLDVGCGLAKCGIFVAVVELESIRHPLPERAFSNVMKEALGHRVVKKCALLDRVKWLRQSFDFPTVVFFLLFEERTSVDEVTLIK